MLLSLTAIFPVIKADTIPSGFSLPLEWRIAAEVSGAWVPGSNEYLRGMNALGRRIDSSFSGAVRAGFSFNPSSREGMLYDGLYQGIGIGVNSFFVNSMLGTPVSAYAYQGAPIYRFTSRLWLGYEWQFGAAFGWHYHDNPDDESFKPVSTPVTAHMGLGVKLHYSVSERWQLSLGIDAHHFSNGNTSIPNAGINSLGASVEIAYTLNPSRKSPAADAAAVAEADRKHWSYDITPFGAWRKRVVTVGEPAEPSLVPGKFGVLGIQLSPMFHFNRWVAVGPALDAQWDESAGLEPYWVQGTYYENIKFVRPPFGRQLSTGLSAHAELTMPIFSVNAGLGYDFISPKGNKRFYQSLTLKAFVTKNVFLNIGYRLGDFSVPQNLMLGIGVRIK